MNGVKICKVNDTEQETEKQKANKEEQKKYVNYKENILGNVDISV